LEIKRGNVVGETGAGVANPKSFIEFQQLSQAMYADLDKV
jgi:hypothetical protein